MGRAGVGVTLATRNANRLRKNRTDAERKLWAALRRKQLNGARFRQQVPLGPYVVDFLCAAHRLIVEVDGSQHSQNAAADNVRTAWLESRGYRVICVWNSDVSERLQSVIEAISLTPRDDGSPPP
jgi:very-short-patch-repair endonuclease